MESQNAATQTQNPRKSYVVLPPEEDARQPGIFSVPFVLFTVLVIGGAVLGGAMQTGKISLNELWGSGKPAVVVAAKAAVAPKAAATPAPVPAPKEGTFVVTTISIGQPSFAIINGRSKGVGDELNAPGATGWRVKAVLEDSVQIQNGATVAMLPLSVQGLKPLDDTLKPLN